MSRAPKRESGEAHRIPAFDLEVHDGKLRRRSGRRGRPEAVRLWSEYALDGIPCLVLQGTREASDDDLAMTALEQYLEEMVPRDPVERALAVQMYWLHVRIGKLTQLAGLHDELDTLKAVWAALDSATNTYRRLAQAWQQLRTPRPVQFIKGQQVNVGEQQVINQNAGAPDAAGPESESENRKCANELGSGHEPAALPSVIPGSGVLEGVRRRAQAVGAEHRPADGGGQDSREPEQPKARAAGRGDEGERG